MSAVDVYTLAEQIVESDPVIRTIASSEWAELSEDGRNWVAAIVKAATERAARRWLSFDSAPKAGEDDPAIPIIVRAARGGRVRVGEAAWLPWAEEWRWANDSCSCCWSKMAERPTHWMPMPDADLNEGGAPC